MKHWGKALIGLAVTVALLWWALSDVTFSEVWANVRRGNPWLLAAAIAVATFGFLLRAMRWKVLLAPVKPDSPFRSRFAAVSIHFMANNLLPLRVGEFARAWVFARLEPVAASATFGSVVVERFMDGVVLLVFLVIPIFAGGFPDPEALSGGFVQAAAVAVVTVLAALVAMVSFPRAFVRLAERVAPVLPRSLRDVLLYSLGSFLESLVVLRDPRLLAVGFAWTFFLWAYHAVSFWLGMLAFGIDTGYLSALFTSSVVGFGVALPSAPGFFGPFHAAVTFAVSDIYGVPDAQSLAFAFAYHFGGWVPITLIGLGYVWRLGLSLGDVGASEDRLEEAGIEGEGAMAELAREVVAVDGEPSKLEPDARGSPP